MRIRIKFKRRCYVLRKSTVREAFACSRRGTTKRNYTFCKRSKADYLAFVNMLMLIFAVEFRFAEIALVFPVRR